MFFRIIMDIENQIGKIGVRGYKLPFKRPFKKSSGSFISFIYALSKLLNKCPNCLLGL